MTLQYFYKKYEISSRKSKNKWMGAIIFLLRSIYI